MQSNQGLTLDRYLEKKPALEPAQAAKVVIQVAQQLAAAAGSLLIHPGRILFERTGTVRLLPPAAEELSLPAVVEYPAYASPEEIRGSQPDVRSGLYSLGCTLYQLLTGEPPYSHPDPKHILHAHLNAPIPDVRTKSPSIPAGIADLTKELLSKDPELRVQTPAELIRRLKQCLLAMQSGGVPAPAPSGAPKVAAAPAAKPRAASPAAAPAPSSLKPPGPGPGLQTPAPQPPASRPHAARSKTRPGVKRGPGSGGTSLKGPRTLGGRPRTRDPLADDLDGEEEEMGPPVKPKKSYPFTIGGAVLGLLVGFYAVHRSGASKEAEKQVLVEKAAADRAQVLVDRKKQLQGEVEKGEKDVQDFLTQIRRSTADRRQALIDNVVVKYAPSSSSHFIIDEYVKVWAPGGTPESAADNAEVDKLFSEHKAAAEKLYSEGKLGLARNKIREDRDANLTLKARHGKEIDDFSDKCDKELTEKWNAMLAEAKKHGTDGEGDKALALYREALVWGEGDEIIRREANKEISSISEQAALQASSKEKASKSLESADAGDNEAAGKDGGEKPAEPESTDPGDAGGSDGK